MKDRASSLKGRLRQSENSFSDAGRHCSQLSAGSCLSHQDFCTEAVSNVQNLVRFCTSQDVIVHDNLDSSLYPGPIMPDCTAHLSESLPRVDWYGSVWLRRPMMRTEWTITALLGISATRESSTRTEALSLMSTGCPGQSGANDMSRCLNERTGALIFIYKKMRRGRPRLFPVRRNPPASASVWGTIRSCRFFACTVWSSYLLLFFHFFEWRSWFSLSDST